MTLDASAREELYDLLDLLFDERIDEVAGRRLAELLDESEEAQWIYLLESNRHAALAWDLGRLNRTENDTAPEPTAMFSPALGMSSTPLSHSFSFDLSVGGVLFSYASSAVLVALVLFVFSMMGSPERRGDIAVVTPTEETSPQFPKEREPQLVSVGRIAAMIDCVWEDKSQAPAIERIQAGDRFALKSGLVEIVYYTGAHVVLEGPCRYEVKSAASGFLRGGKVVALVERKGTGGVGRGARDGVASGERRVASPPLPPGEGGVRVMREQQTTASDAVASGVASREWRVASESPAPRPSSPVPLFAIHTPTAVVTDLGTEFGVEVKSSGETTSHVFQGRVKIVGLTDGKPQGGEIELGANQSARVNKTKDGVEATLIGLDKAKPDKFVRLKDIREVPLQPFRHWQAMSKQLQTRNDLLAYYDFEPDEANRTILRNRAATGRQFDGKIEGSEWVTGRYLGKHALKFGWPKDGVRIDIPAPCKQLTLVAWMRMNAVVEYASILATDGWNESGKPGKVHFLWNADGNFHFGHWDAVGAYAVAPFPGFASDARWHMVACVADLRTQRVAVYVDGRTCGEKPMLEGVSTDFMIGRAMIGRWECLTNTGETDRCLRGCIDEMLLFRSALSAEEIARLYKDGNPANRPALQKAGQNNRAKQNPSS